MLCWVEVKSEQVSTQVKMHNRQLLWQNEIERNISYFWDDIYLKEIMVFLLLTQYPCY